jgi:ferredoxin
MSRIDHLSMSTVDRIHDRGVLYGAILTLRWRPDWEVKVAKFHVAVDQRVCGGHGECVVSAPEVFDFLGDDVVVSVTTPTPGPDQYRPAMEARDRCPNAAIRVERD